jgi:endonuclease/exonuclease/phosphatase (EEP) superfamily protein YafD
VFDLLASFRPQLALALAVLALLLTLGHRRRTAGLVAAALAINLVVIAPLFFGPVRSERADLRVLSFNLLSSNESYEEVIDFIRSSHADLVVLHEASRPWEEAVAEARLPYQVTASRSPGDIFGSLVLAPDGSAVESYGFGLTDPRAVAIELPDGVSVLAIHPLSPYTRFRSGQRARQLQFAADWAQGQTGPRIVVGDFNAGPFSYPFRRLLADTGLADSARGFGLELSYPATSSPLVRVGIDQLLYSQGLSVTDRRLGSPFGSDHFPLTVDLALVG